jgi:hypothetical protein
MRAVGLLQPAPRPGRALDQLTWPTSRVRSPDRLACRQRAGRSGKRSAYLRISRSGTLTTRCRSRPSSPTRRRRSRATPCRPRWWERPRPAAARVPQRAADRSQSGHRPLGRVRYIAVISVPCLPFTAWPAARRLGSLETSASTWSGVCSTAALAIGIPLPRHPGSLATPSQQMLTRQTRHLGLSLVSMTLSSHVGLLLRPGRTGREIRQRWSISCNLTSTDTTEQNASMVRLRLAPTWSSWLLRLAPRRPGRGRVAERSLGPSSSARISPPSRRGATGFAKANLTTAAAPTADQ